MAIFSRKSKGKKEEVKKEEVTQPVEKNPAQFRKYTPRHVGSQGGATENYADFDSIASQMRKQNTTFDSTLPDASSFSYGNNLNTSHGASTPSSVSRRGPSNDTFTTHANDYFSPGAMRRLQANDPSLGYTKVALARHDQGLGQCSSDSGYESAGPSRVASEHNLDDMSRQYLPRPNGGLLPELKLDDSHSDRSSKSTTKKTRFLDTDAAPVVEQPAVRAEPQPQPEARREPQPEVRIEPQPVVRTVPQPTVHVEQLPLSAPKPNLAALEGHKVNKKGKVLDEEGDVIGELVEGDLLDCVRQKVNAKGEVLDDVGKIVGIVKLSAAALLPALTVRPPTSSSPDRVVAPRESIVMDPPRSPEAPPRSPVLDTTPNSQSTQEASRRAARTASERSLSELSKPYARPPMSSVPENNVPEHDAPLASPELFAYKGDIPEGPHQHMRRRSSSPPQLSAHMSGRRPNPRRVSSSAMSSKSLGKQPMGYASRRNPLGSFDNSPNGSDDGTETSNSDDGKPPAMNFRRPASVRSTMSVPAKPRTYFSHAGKITVDINAPEPVAVQVAKAKPAVEATPPPAETAVKEEKKKSKFGMRFGKK